MDFSGSNVDDCFNGVKGPNMARGGVNSLFKNSTNSLEQEVSKKQSEAFSSSSNGVFASHLSNNSS